MSDWENIRRNREALGLSRSELAIHAGVTIGALASVESGRGSRDKAALMKIMTSLQQLITPASKAEASNGDAEAPAHVPRAYRKASLEAYEKMHPDYTVEYEYMGLTPESRFTVTGEEGVFIFVRLVTNPKGSQWVDAFGGERNEFRARAFRPERVNPM